MTELETLLLNALDELQQQHDRRQQIYQQEQQVLREMFGRIMQDNQSLKEQLDTLNGHVASLQKQLARFSPS